MIMLPHSSSAVTADDILSFYNLIKEELRVAQYPDEIRRALLDKTCGHGRLFTDEEYFKQNYCQPFSDAVNHLSRLNVSPRILDLCCGTGTQSLFFGFMGARVDALDYDDQQLSALRHRIAYYRRETQSRLSITVRKADATTLNVASLGPYDAIYSHIGIGGLLKAEHIFSRIAATLNPGGLLVLKNGNPDCLWLRVKGRKPRDSSRDDYLVQARDHGFRPISIRGTAGLPRQAWRPVVLGRAASRILSSFLPFQLGISYIFERLPDASGSSRG